jgi:hypothetical protein
LARICWGTHTCALFLAQKTEPVNCERSDWRGTF